ncbi:hypothetical protein HK096_003338 [Nowakowskiella sp. JEL0078]|nr:hypothetical protein HK096_003338 [Nowakowskiella sp. JEL0078]
MIDRKMDAYHCMVDKCIIKFLSPETRNQHLIEQHCFPSDYDFDIVKGLSREKQKNSGNFQKKLQPNLKNTSKDVVVANFHKITRSDTNDFGVVSDVFGEMNVDGINNPKKIEKKKKKKQARKRNPKKPEAQTMEFDGAAETEDHCEKSGKESLSESQTDLKLMGNSKSRRYKRRNKEQSESEMKNIDKTDSKNKKLEITDIAMMEDLVMTEITGKLNQIQIPQNIRFQRKSNPMWRLPEVSKDQMY